MGNYAFFIMDSTYRNYLIENHRFFVSHAKNRLLSQFDNLEQQADSMSEEWLNKTDIHFDPDRHDPSSVLEDVYHKRIEYYGLLVEMRNMTQLNIIVGMFHMWEKVVRDWLTSEIRHWHRGKAVQGKIWSMTFEKLVELLECLGWEIKQEICYPILNQCRLVVNAYKHGEGSSFEQLKIDHPEFFKQISPAGDFSQIFTYSDLKVEDHHLDIFSQAIIDFWINVPQEIRENQNPKFPQWFVEATEKDQKNQ